MRPLLEVVTLRREGERTLPNFPFPSILSSSSYSLPPCPDIIQHGGDSDSATLAVSHLPPTPRPHNSIADGQKFQNVENDENRFFAITSSKLFKN